MKALSKELRAKLEKVVVKAREVADEGACAVLQQYAVDAPQPYEHLSADERELRRRLRTRARQLGDKRVPETDAHGIEHLVAEFAYEHWHRMLFARFLSENNLLIHPQEGVPVSLADCEDLAAEEDAANGWKLAERYAAEMLPQIFRLDAPVLALTLPPEYHRELEGQLDSLPVEVFAASDSLGWVYQFWQSKRKDEINKSEVKIGADELPAVTQLFTEPYMVQFLLDNSLGAWWTSRHPGEKPPVEFEYLRMLDDGTPAAGKFDGWPDKAKELKILDPCCGSGHFLVTAFRMLVPIRIWEEGLEPQEACVAVLKDNLHGLELDERCTQIAAFALALAAWTYPNAGGYRPLSEMRIACSGLSVGAKREEWLRFAGSESRLQEGMGQLYSLFQDAPTLGSLIDPTKNAGDLLAAGFSELEPLLQIILERERERSDVATSEIGITAQCMANAAELLSGSYHLVITNVPYLVRGKQDEKLKEFSKKYYDLSKNDLATVFLERCLGFNKNGGTTAIVLPQNWLFLTIYKKLREKLLRENTWNIVARLGPQAFQTPMWDFNVQLLILNRGAPAPQHELYGIDASESRMLSKKKSMLRQGEVKAVKQAEQLSNPNIAIVFKSFMQGKDPLSMYADVYHGITTTDYPRFGRYFWEIFQRGHEWIFQQTTVPTTIEYGGLKHLLFWDNDGAAIRQLQNAGAPVVITGLEAWGKKGVAINQMNNLNVSIYSGEAFDTNIAIMIPKVQRFLLPVWAYLSSPHFNKDVREFNQSVKVEYVYFNKVPFDFEHWQKVTEERYPKGLPEPYSEDPTQWIFKGTIVPSEAPLQVAVARLLGYRWPEQVEDGLDDLIDEDGIVCVPVVRSEESAESRLKTLLARAYGDKWKAGTLDQLIEGVGYKGKSLDTWLRDVFFEQHVKLFHHRPFIWHIWDGSRRDGFAAFVNFHKLNRKRLEILTYTYLGDWIRRQEDDLKREVGGAEARLLAARELQEKLKKILEGEKPYDIFVRWKPLEEQPIGWEPDLNDGVRLNIRPFVIAGVLRKDPKINWNKDRGKDPEDSRWGVERINDRNLSLEEKRKARAAVNKDNSRAIN